MIPRIHKRGTSFKSAVQYVLHDPQKETADRLDWAFSVNCGALEPAESWQPMYETWDRRTALKREAGVDLRGADNKAPVMHYTLSWAPDDRPSKAEMMDAALNSLKAIGLEKHQALIAAHNDKDHLHVHIIVNTVNPETGKTAALKYPALALRDFAREHDRQRGIVNARRAERTTGMEGLPPYRRNPEERAKAMAMLKPAPIIMGMKPERPERSHRRRALQKQDTINRMKRMRAEHNHAAMVERDALASVHRTQRDVVFRNGQDACRVAVDYVRDRFKSRWRDLYDGQQKEARHVDRILSNPLERAVYVFVNSERLNGGPPLTLKQKASLIASPRKLSQAVVRMHKRERHLLASVEKVETKERLDRAWNSYEASLTNLKAAQQAERQTLKDQQRSDADRSISYYHADYELMAERRGEMQPRSGAHPFETDELATARIRKAIDTHYRRQFGEDSVPLIPWKEAAKPVLATEPEPAPENEDEEVRKYLAELARRQQERDTGNER